MSVFRSIGAMPQRAARILALALVAVAACAVTATASAATYADSLNVDGDGYYDALVRESPWLSQSDVGALCTYVGNSLTLEIRPPRVWPISGSGLSQQSVAWRAVYTDMNNQIVAYGQPIDGSSASGGWIGGTAMRGQPTEFGSGGDPASPNVWANSYYTGSESFTHSADSSVVPWIEVAWLRSDGTWSVHNYMRVSRIANIYGYTQAGFSTNGNC